MLAAVVSVPEAWSDCCFAGKGAAVPGRELAEEQLFFFEHGGEFVLSVLYFNT